MIATIKHLGELAVDYARFVAAVWRDARAMQAEAEGKHGHLGY